MKDLKATRTDHDEAYFQLALSRVEGIGSKSLKKLVNHFGSAKAVFGTSAADLVDVSGMSWIRAKAIASFSGFDRVAEELRYANERGLRVLAFTDSAYPNRLKHCVDGPAVLFVNGSADLSPRRILSIVGTRRITGYGKSVTRKLVEYLAPHDVTVVSGLAYGIDIEAHRACLDFEVPTVAVLGHGLDVVYPASHTPYADRIALRGALVSEFVTGTRPDRENFPRRNRIVAGMCDATVVVESGVRGGSMITAGLALDYNRDVFAVPGRIGDAHSEGCNRLIKTSGAALLESPEEFLKEMGWAPRKDKKAVQRKIFVDLSPEEERLMAVLREKTQAQIDELGLLMGMPTSQLLVHLLNLELNGVVRSLPGKRYELC